MLQEDFSSAPSQAGPCRVAGTIWVSRESGHLQDSLLPPHYSLWQTWVFFCHCDFLMLEVWVCCVFIRSSLWFHAVEEVLRGFLCSSHCPGVGESCVGHLDWPASPLEIKSFIQRPENGFKCLISGSHLPKPPTFLLCSFGFGNIPCCCAWLAKACGSLIKCPGNKFWAHLFVEIRWQ